MAMSDPLGDMLTRIRNGQRTGKSKVRAPASKLRANVLEVLKREGYIRDYRTEEVGRGLAEVEIEQQAPFGGFRQHPHLDRDQPLSTKIREDLVFGRQIDLARLQIAREGARAVAEYWHKEESVEFRIVNFEL